MMHNSPVTAKRCLTTSPCLLVLTVFGNDPGRAASGSNRFRLRSLLVRHSSSFLEPLLSFCGQTFDFADVVRTQFLSLSLSHWAQSTN